MPAYCNKIESVRAKKGKRSRARHRERGRKYMRDRAKKLCMKLLAAVMVISMMIPVTAFAQDEEAGVSAQASDALTLGLNWTSGEKEVVTGKT